MALEIGTVLEGRYELLRLMGAGGMGEVYRGKDRLRGDRPVAIKRMLLEKMVEVHTLEEGEESPAALISRKFDDEVEMLKRLDAPGIPRFYDSFSLEDGAKCIVMEFVEGQDLETELKESLALALSPLAEEDVVDLGIQLCRILEYLHSQQPEPIIHRDVKPANVIKKGKQIYLVDFGLARGVGTQSTKTLVGTVGYAPLEQFEGKPEPRSDQYALGATLHHLVTGKPPMPLHIQAVEELRPDINPELAVIINKATSTDKNQRFENLGQMRLHLAAVMPKLGNNSQVFVKLEPPPGEEGRDPREQMELETAKAPTKEELLFEEEEPAPLAPATLPLGPVGILLVIALVYGLLVVGQSLARRHRLKDAAPFLMASQVDQWEAVAAEVEPGSRVVILRSDDSRRRPGVAFRRPEGGLPQTFQFRAELGQSPLLVFFGGQGLLLEDHRRSNQIRASLVEVAVAGPRRGGGNPLNFVTYRRRDSGRMLGTLSKDWEVRIRNREVSVYNAGSRVVGPAPLNEPARWLVGAVSLHRGEQQAYSEIGHFEVISP